MQACGGIAILLCIARFFNFNNDIKLLNCFAGMFDILCT